MFKTTNPVEGFYGAASDNLMALASVVAFSGVVIPITPPHPNSSYTLIFYGPSLHCHPFPRPELHSDTGAAYYASAPLNDSISLNDQLQMLNISTADQASDTAACDTEGLNTYYRYLDLNSSSDGSQGTKLYVVWPGISASECRLYNSSYTVDFAFTNGLQDISVRQEDILHEVTATGNLADPHSGDDLYVDARFKIMNYQSIMECVGSLIGGWLTGPLAGGEGVDGASRVRSTVLVDTEEFDGYRADMNLPMIGDGPGRNRSFIFGVESLMRNITLSLFANKLFL